MELRNAYQSLIPVASNDYAQTQTTFENYILNLPVDIFQQAELIIDTLSQLGVVHAKAAGRREDQFLLNAQYAAGNAFNPPVTNPPISGGGNKLPDQEPPGLVPGNFGSTAGGTVGVNLNVAKIIRAAIIMDQNNVPHEDRYLVVNAAMIGALMSDGEKPTNILYNNTKTLMQGGVDTFMGFKIITLGNRSEGGIQLRPNSGQAGLPDPNTTAPITQSENNATAIAWHKNSLGAVYALNPITEVEWSPTHQSWLTISRLRMGASNLLGHGVVFIDCKDTAGPTGP